MQSPGEAAGLQVEDDDDVTQLSECWDSGMQDTGYTAGFVSLSWHSGSETGANCSGLRERILVPQYSSWSLNRCRGSSQGGATTHGTESQNITVFNNFLKNVSFKKDTLVSITPGNFCKVFVWAWRLPQSFSNFGLTILGTLCNGHLSRDKTAALCFVG